MIKVDAIGVVKTDSAGNAYSGVEITGNSEIVRLELLLAITLLLKNNVIKDKDKKAIKNVLDLDYVLLDTVAHNIASILKNL